MPTARRQDRQTYATDTEREREINREQDNVQTDRHIGIQLGR